jgi:autotransporter-associated beta strand protein
VTFAGPGNIVANNVGFSNGSGTLAVNVSGGHVTLMNGNNTYTGATTLTGGVLALGNDGSTDASLSGTANIIINAGATLDVSGRSDTTLALGTGAASQALHGSGTLTGNLTVGSLGTVAPGLSIGTLTVSGNVTLGGKTVMELNRAVSPNSDKLAAPAITGGGVLTVTNIGGTALHVGDTFHLFNSGVSGFATVNLPTVDNGYAYTWNNQIGANGTIIVLTAVQAVNTNSATANFAATVTGGGNSLQFSWAADHKGWQLYTNAVGLSATGSWFPVPGSANGTSATVPINPAKPNVFFQLRYP